MLLIRNRTTMTPSPTKIQISSMCEIPNISPPLSSAPNVNHKGHKTTRRKSNGFASHIFASFLALPDQVQVIHDLLRLTMAEKHFAVRQRDAYAGIAPNVGTAIADTAYAV